MKKVIFALSALLVLAMFIYFSADQCPRADRAWYTSVTTTSTTLNDLYPGGATGAIREELGKEYILVKAAGTIADGYTFKKDATSSAVVTVIATTDSCDYALGVNNTGGSISSGTFFWGLHRGLGYGAMDASGWVDGNSLGPSNTDGKIAAQTVTQAGDKIFGVAVKDSSSTLASTSIFFNF